MDNERRHFKSVFDERYQAFEKERELWRNRDSECVENTCTSMIQWKNEKSDKRERERDRERQREGGRL